MRKLLPVFLSAGTVFAVVLSAGLQFHQEVRVWQVQHVESAEVLRLYASNQAVIDQALDDVTVPPFVIVGPLRARTA